MVESPNLLLLSDHDQQLDRSTKIPDEKDDGERITEENIQVKSAAEKDIVGDHKREQ